MNTDSHFTIGKSHKVNQDYADHGSGFVLVSDGCSSSNNTDFGSRLLVKTYKNFINHEEGSFFHALEDSLHIINRLRMSEESLDATLLSIKTDDKKYYLQVSGDGFFAKVKNDGSIEYKSFSYPSGAPYYLNYINDMERMNKYKELYGTKLIIKTYNENLLLNQEEIENCFVYKFEESLDNIKYLSVMTDGIASFVQPNTNETSKSNIQVPEYNIIKELVGYKNSNGEFVKRRMHAFAKHCIINNWENIDDYSVGTIFINDKHT